MFKLEDIKDPSFLSNLTNQELEILAKDIREFLISNISKTGGHLSSNLGVVELTIVLHAIFESPKDKIIFDVGHQSYTHKILTGRASQFKNLRKYKGLSGFIKREESIHDVYEAGHSSTSLAAAAGIEFAKTYDKNIGKVIAMIGDGALTGGMAFESLNFLGNYSNHHPIIILNDNEMSITENIGYLGRVLTDIRSKSSVRKFRGNLAKITPKFARRLTTKVNRSIKAFLSSNTLFDDLGFTYIGPINGHNIKELKKYLTIAKNSNRPVVLHVLTEKGKGYKYSAKDKIGSWHGVGPFNIESGEVIKNSEKNIHSFSTIVAKYMSNYAENNEKFTIVIPAMIAGSSLLKFKEQYPDRIIDVGIAEQTAVTMSSGLAISGVKVFTPIYSTFIQRAYDQVNHDVARQDLHVVFGIDRAGLVGPDGETHQGIYDIPLLRHIPNLIMAEGKDAIEVFKLLNYAFNVNKHPFVLRYPRENTEYDFANGITNEAFTDTSWEYLAKGTKGTFITFGPILNKVVDSFNKNMIDVNIVNARFIKPLDFKMLDEISKMDTPIIIYEESIISGGFASSVLEYFISKKYDTRNIEIMAIPEMYVEQGTRDELLRDLELNVESVLKKAQKVFK
ncbi:MAG: 1-deoxy-D-xylulose-5-phosphate synthase [Candidatus Izemoplasma sp.]